MTPRIPRPAASRHAARSIFCALACLGLPATLVLAPARPALAQETALPIRIAAQPLDSALIQLGRQTPLQFFYAPETVAGIQAPAIDGRMTPEQALKALLAGTTLAYQREGRNVTLSRPASATQLEPVTVIGAGGPDLQAEGLAADGYRSRTISSLARWGPCPCRTHPIR